MARSNPPSVAVPQMQERYTVETGGKFATVKSCAGPVGVAVAVCSLKRPFTWVEVENPYPWARHVIVNENINVYQHKL